MKIGIMTFPNTTSYGAVLQMYGLYRAVERFGAKAEIVNYQNSFMKEKRHTSAGQKRSGMAGKLRLQAANLLHTRQAVGFRNFEKKMRRYPAKPLNDAAGLPGLAGRYDGVICGSDQVWNPHITDTDLSYFLNFCGKDTKRIAYAPSFGISDFPESFVQKITPELRQFAHLSVREPDGAQLAGSLTDRNVPTVLDPTFLIPCQEWEAVEKEHPLAKQQYVLYFPVRKSAALLRFSRELAEKRNAKLIVAEGNFLRQLRNKDPNVQYALDLSPGEWLYLMHHADCVVTNSFHGAAFAIHYQKDFYLELSSKTNSRLNQLMEVTGLEDRVVKEGSAPWDAHIDYAQVEARIAPVRAASLDYLKQAVCEGA